MSYSSATDNFGKIIHSGLMDIFDAEFPRDHIVHQPEFRPQDLARRNEYIRVYPGDSSQLEAGAMYEARAYNYQLSFYKQFSGEELEKTFEDVISQKWNHIYFYLMGFRNYEPATGYVWHNIVFEDVSGVLWGIEDEEGYDEVGHIDATVSFWRTNEFELTELALGGGLGL